MHKQNIPFGEYEEFVTVISMIYNGKENFWENSTDQNENLEYANERYVRSNYKYNLIPS